MFDLDTIEMNAKLQILLTTIAAVSSSFLQSPSHQFQSAFNSTFIKENDKLFKPIIIPNITKILEQPNTPKTYETHGTKANEIILNKDLQPQSQESAARENFSEKLKTNKNFLKFSSKYSTKPEIQSERWQKETNVETTQIPEKNDSATEIHNSFSERSDDLGTSEEEDTFRYESREPERSETVPTTNEPFSESQRPRNGLYNDGFENYETTSAVADKEEPDSSEEKEEDDSKRSIHDYHNSGSKNYHSIQTPLSQVKYKGSHSYGDDFEPEKTKTRLVKPINSHHIKHNWPYTRPQIKEELEKLNEISDSDESYETELDNEIKEEVKAKPDLELAVAKDELKFDRNKKYNIIEERDRRKHLLKGLTAEEEKDDRRPLFPSLKQYQVNEEPRHQHRFKPAEEWSSKSTTTTPKNIFKVKTPPNRKPKHFGITNESPTDFQGHRFLGPVVFNQNVDQQKFTPVTKAHSKIIQKAPTRNIFLDGLIEKENLDQANLNNKKIQKWTAAHTQSFNHMEESDEMYKEILANIQSVFGVRTQPLKSGSGSRSEVSLDESKSFTWSLPLKKRENSLKSSE